MEREFIDKKNEELKMKEKREKEEQMKKNIIISRNLDKKLEQLKKPDFTQKINKFTTFHFKIYIVKHMKILLVNIYIFIIYKHRQTYL